MKIPLNAADPRLADWLQRLESMQPDRVELGLERVRRVARQLGLLQPDYPVITVAGTNGKGSTAAFIAEILRGQGLSVGVYSSPHFVRFNERISVDGTLISDSELIDAFEFVAAGSSEAAMTYFEFTTLAAVHFFARCQVDVAVLEVGLGGRLDAVNIWDSEVACITSIGIDHVAWLGDNREAIGAEKAAVARTGKALICGDPSPPESIAEVAHLNSARLLRYQCDYHALSADKGHNSKNPGDKKQGWRYSSDIGRYDLSQPAIKASWATNNAATAVCVCEQFLQHPLEPSVLQSAMRNVTIRGRLQTATVNGVAVLLDVAHNPHACAALADYLENNPVAGTNRAVFACMNDKEIDDIIGVCRVNIGDWLLGDLDYQRAADPEHLLQQMQAADAQLQARIYPSVSEAFQQAVAKSHADDRVVVFGSFLTVAAVLEWMDRSLAGDSDD